MGGRDSFKMDEMGAHARLYEKIVHSPAWLALGFSSRALYVQLRVKLKQISAYNEGRRRVAHRPGPGSSGSR